MDLITHTLSGMAVGATVMNVTKQKYNKHVFLFLGLGTLGGFLPDVDAISLWSKFDATIGSLLQLKVSGSAMYFGKYTWSHHGIMHSLLFPLFYIALFLSLRYFLTKRKLNWKKALPVIMTFILGYYAHLLEDLPTPASVWGGVRLFYPFDTYVGGSGQIWWWNNYDLFLLVVLLILLQLGWYVVNLKFKTNVKIFGAKLIFFLAFIAFNYQVASRPLSFAYQGHTSKYQEYEAASLQYQKELLGDRLYGWMLALDNMIPLYF